MVIGAIATGLSHLALFHVVIETFVFPFVAFFTSSWSTQTKVVAPAIAFAILTLPAVLGSARISKVSVAVLGLFFGGSVIYVYLTWQEAVWRYGIEPPLIQHGLAFLVLVLLAAFIWWQRRRAESLLWNCLFHLPLVLWPFVIGFPYLGEGP